MKKTLILMTMVIILILSGCTKSNIKQLDEEGNRIRKEYSELTEGFWVRNKDDTFSPLCVLMEGYAGYAKESHPKRYVWFTNNGININNIIPIIYPGQELIVKAAKTSKVPEALSLERYKNVGYTIGVHFTLNENGKMIMKLKDFCQSSVAGSIIGKNKEAGLEDDIIIDEFNNTKNVPTRAVNKAMNMILGLEKDGKYQLGFYTGTQYQSMEVPADTIAFQSAEVIDIIENVYNKTKEGYFSVAFPKTLKEGYYIINGIGLFYYQTKETADNDVKSEESAIEDIKENPLVDINPSDDIKQQTIDTKLNDSVDGSKENVEEK